MWNEFNAASPAPGMLVFDIPLPPPEASVNNHGNRVGKLDIIYAYKEEVRVVAVDVRNRFKWKAPQLASVSWLFGLRRPQQRRGAPRPRYYYPSDYDNAVASLKQAQDAFVEAGLLAEDDWEHLECRSIRPCFTDGPWVRVTLEALA